VRVTSVVNGFDVALERNTLTGGPQQRGYALALPLPVFDGGDALRAGARAAYLSALNGAAQAGVDAASELRETYAAYGTAWRLARHYRQEVVPLRKAIADENLLRYNGMLIGVFELLADAREQIASVSLAMEAERDFWRADAALAAAQLGH
jgi:outer membrane protein TolC